MRENWQPSADVCTHSGQPVDQTMRFPCMPPSEIGTVLTAFSTIEHNKSPMSFGVRFGIAGIVFLLIMAGVSYFLLSVMTDFTLPVCLGIGAVSGGVIGLIVFLATGSNLEVTYVGEQGAAKYRFADPDDAPSDSDLILFRDVKNILTSETRHYTNGIYTGTSYNFTFKGHNGEALMSLVGQYRGENGTPGNLKDPYFFARVCENVYNDHAIERLAEDFERNGFVSFDVRNGDTIKIGPGYLEFDFGGKVERLTTEEVKSLDISGGTFRVRSNDASFWGSKGKYDFQYGQMGNAQLFLHALSQLAGFSFD